MIGNQPAESGDRLAWEIKAVAERLRRLSPARLRMPWPPYPSRAQAGRMLAQRLADAASGVAARGADQPPEWREVPEIELFAVGEQVAVTGADLVRELAGGADHAAGTESVAGSGGVGAGSGGVGAGSGGVGAGFGAAGAVSADSGPSDVVGGRSGGVVGGGSGAGGTAVPADAMVWTRSGRRPVSAITEELLATLRELRLGL